MKINIADIIDGRAFSPLQIGLFTLCGFCLLMTGFNVQIMGYVAPAVMPEFGMSSSELGNVLGAGNFGVLLGALVFTIVGDKIGRRPVLVGATLFYAFMTLWACRATSTEELLTLRFFGGVGMGADCAPRITRPICAIKSIIL